MRDVHRVLGEWMEQAGCRVTIDAVGNLRGFYAASREGAPRLVIGSHLDTVPDAGAFDGVLGVVLGLALIEGLSLARLGFSIELIGFSEEEGVRYAVPFIGSRAVTGTLDPDIIERIGPAIREFGLDPAGIPAAALANDVIGFVEFHIEQGPVLESLGRPLGIVETIVGQSRFALTFVGAANHAGTTPMHLRRDALATAAEWIGAVEEEGRSTAGLAATVGALEVESGAANVIAGRVCTSLDVRHPCDEDRRAAVRRLVSAAEAAGAARSVEVETRPLLDRCATAMDHGLTARLEAAAIAEGFPPHRMASGAGHDAMILAHRFPAAMLFLRTPGGISHHPDESVIAEDVDCALAVGARFLAGLEADYA
jgi:allantoate deiminase